MMVHKPTPLRRRFSAQILLIWGLCLPLLISSAAAQRASVVAQHGDLQRTGWNKQETTLTVDNVSASSFGKAYSVNVDDQIYAQPLVMSHVAIGDGPHNVVYVATVNNAVYAVDADNSLVYWSKTYTPAGQRAPKNTDMTGACGGNYRDFSGNMGIVGTGYRLGEPDALLRGPLHRWQPVFSVPARG